MDKELQSHKNSDKIKWIITAIAFVLVFVLLGGLYALQFRHNEDKKDESPSSEASAEIGYMETNKATLRAATTTAIAYDDNSISTIALPSTLASTSCGITTENDTYNTGDAFYNTASKLCVYLNEEQIFEGKYNGPNTTYMRYGGGNEYNYYCITYFTSSNFTGYSSFVEIMNKYTNFKVTTTNPKFGGSACNWYDGKLRLRTTTYRASVNNLTSGDLGGYDVVITCEKKPVQLPPTPSKEGHHFVGWYYDEQFERPYQGEPIYEDTDLYAKFEINTYTVTFDSNGGSSVTSQKVNWNTSASLSNPTRAGYTFEGWFLPDETQYTDQPIKEDTKLTAHWKAIMCTVTFYVDGEEYDSLEVEYGTSLSTVDSIAENLGLRVNSYSSVAGQKLGKSITSDLNVSANTVKASDNNNQWKIIGGVAGGLCLVALIAGVIGAVKRKRS